MKMFALLMMMFDGGSGEAPQVQLLDFSASYCQPCKQMEPIIQAMARDGFPVRQIDITEEHELARRFQVDRVPTLVLLVEGKEAKRFVGLTSADELRREMNAAARKLAESRPESSTAGSGFAESDAFEQSGSDDFSPARRDTLSEEAGNTPGPKRLGLGDRLKSWLGRGEVSPPTVRGQSPDNDQRKDALVRAFNATVRVKVTGTRSKDQQFVQDVGTGTIVQSTSGEAIVLTCAHLFLGISKSDVKVIIEVFENGKATSYPGSVIAGNHDSDVALLKFQTSKTLPAVPLLAQVPANTIGQPLMSIGCNNGNDPTLMETKLIAVNRYEGPANLVCEKDPEGGRSGGGLFNTNGDLVAICSCADRKRKEGLYMALPVVLQLVEKHNLTSILKQSAEESIVQGGDDVSDMKGDIFADEPTTRSEVKSAESDAMAGTGGDVFGDSFGDPADDPVPSAGESMGANEKKTLIAGEDSDLEPEVVIEIADRTNGGKKRRVVIPKASPWLLEMLGDDVEMTPPAAVASTLRKPLANREATSTRGSGRPSASTRGNAKSASRELAN